MLIQYGFFFTPNKLLGEGNDLGDFDRVPVHAVIPRAVRRSVDRPDAAPNCAVTLKPAAEADHPNPIAFPHPAFGLHIRQLVPQRTARRIPEPMESHPRGLDVPRLKPEAALKLVDDGAAAGVDAEVIESLAEVGNVRGPGGGEGAAGDEGEEEAELFGGGEDEGADGGDVGAERIGGDGHKVFGEGDADLAERVFLLVDAEEGAVVGPAVGADDVEEAVFAEAAGGGVVGEEGGRGAHAEEAVGEEHRAGLAGVVVRAEDFG
ncbi:hypothetical protein IEQ34_003601 [Dendrobium chrysotoxum]|uniref:Uncharacterized protein n=1 Tax=Dendrobium chrysotoxum TaxID=161865 RepID=A0AAV7HKE6_DENCH|nr:hypothetical protein IEQ34_003601 [Dendrobium chrysotoxum]